MQNGPRATTGWTGASASPRRRTRILRLAGWAASLAAVAGVGVLGACAERDEDPGSTSYLELEMGEPASTNPEDTIAGTNWTWEDWEILEEKVRWAVSEGLDTVPMGDAVARLGVTFVGTTYTPGTLEAPGPEHLVINLRELDCVTFIENLLALTWMARNEGTEILSDRPAAMRRYEEYLTEVRYRDGILDGYPSRLHYFSEWLANNEASALVRPRTQELGGIPDPEPIDFMTRHRDSYRQLADPEDFEAVRRIEERLTAEGPRHYVPQEAITEVEDGIRDGDLIAATSTVPGLDIAHTGIALWRNGRLHLLHAPLVGRNVEISELPLAERIREISGQDGIMVAEPLEWPGRVAAGMGDATPGR